jgi:radical SAM protein with 4Fe4S-binding SPASM domain
MTRRALPAARLGGNPGAHATGTGPVTGCRFLGSPAAGVMSVDADQAPGMVSRLLAMACGELNRHANDRGRCRACQARFPCSRACLAEQILSWF